MAIKKTTPAKKSTPSKPTPSRALATIREQPLAKQMPSAPAFEEDAGKGQENMGRNDLAIPRLTILQDMSDQVKKKQPGYIDGAEVGMIIDTLSNELFDGDEGILVLPISYRRTHLEWKPKRGGFVADHGPSDDILIQCDRSDEGQMIHRQSGNIIQVSAEYFVFLLDEDGNSRPYVVSMSGSKLKVSRRWNTMINTLQVPKADGSGVFNPAMFYRSYRLTTVPEQSAKGSYMNWKVTGAENVTELPRGNELYTAARAFREQIATGAVQAAAPREDGGAGHESDAAPM